jgi:large subunit ribosomal protein L24
MIKMKSTSPRKQRKEMFNAPLHKKRKWLSSHLEENLLLKYDKRSITVIKGDTVRVMRGSFRGHEDKVAHVNVGKRSIEVEGITMSNAKGNKIAKPLHPSNVMITKLDLTDKWRRKKLERGLSEETKKEIEKEAERQIKEVEETKIKEEKEKELEEKEETVEETEEKEEKPKPIDEEKKVTEEPKTKAKSIKEEPEKTKKKTSVKKKPAKKTPVKTSKKKEENK